jgi:hypothetical protein
MAGALVAQKVRRLATRFEHGASGVTGAFRCVDGIARMCAFNKLSTLCVRSGQFVLCSSTQRLSVDSSFLDFPSLQYGFNSRRDGFLMTTYVKHVPYFLLSPALVVTGASP